MYDIFPFEAAHDFLCNDYFMVIQIVCIIINLIVFIYDNDTTIIDGREHINLCLNIAALHICSQRHIFTCRYLICQNFCLA